MRKKTRKKKMDSSNPSMDCVIKWGNLFINSIIFYFFIFSFIMQQRKNS